MNVGELRKLIAHADDDLVIWVDVGDGTALATRAAYLIPPMAGRETPTLLFTLDRGEYAEAESFVVEPPRPPPRIAAR